MRLLRKPDRHFQIAGGTHKPQMPVRSETHKQSVMLVTCCPQTERNPKCSLCPSSQNSADFFAGTGTPRGKRKCGFGDGVIYKTAATQKLCAPRALSARIVRAERAHRALDFVVPQKMRHPKPPACWGQ